MFSLLLTALLWLTLTTAESIPTTLLITTVSQEAPHPGSNKYRARHRIDSISPFEFKSYGARETETRMELFAIRHSALCILNVKNEGDKSFTALQVLFPPDSYVLYEYKDSNGQLHKGKITGKFSIGDLSSSETREIYLWSKNSAFHNGVTIVHADGSVKAERPVEVTGTTAWLALHSHIISAILSAIITMFGIHGLVKILERRFNQQE